MANNSSCVLFERWKMAPLAVIIVADNVRLRSSVAKSRCSAYIFRIYNLISMHFMVAHVLCINALLFERDSMIWRYYFTIK